MTLIHFLLYPLLLAAAAGAPDKLVRYLDDNGLAEIKASPSTPVVIKVDPIGCERAPGTCKPLNTFWETVAAVYPGRVWRLSCAEQQKLCQGQAAFDPSASKKLSRGREPMFYFWVDGEFELYTDASTPEDLIDHIQEDILPKSARKGGKHITSAFDAADKYSHRKATITKGESMMVQGRFKEALAILSEYIDKYPDHLNGILMAAKAASSNKQHEIALSIHERALKQEPNNSHLLGSQAMLMRNLGRCGDAMRYIKQFYDVDSESQDFDWDNTDIIEDLKEYCQNQPIYRSINTEHSEL